MSMVSLVAAADWDKMLTPCASAPPTWPYARASLPPPCSALQDYDDDEAEEAEFDDYDAPATDY